MYRKSYYRWLILGTVSLGTFMATLDGGIVNVALPNIARSLNSDLPVLQWVITAYLLTISSLLPIFGRLADIVGQKKIYSFGFIVFIVGSLLSAFAPTVTFLIFSRVFQAIGAAMLMSNGVGLITGVFPAKERGKALGLIGTVVAVGSMTGPMVGGLLISFFGWKAIFLVNVPIGIIGFIVAQFVIKKEAQTEEKEPFDVKGAIYFSTGIILFLLALSNGEKWGWNSPFVLASIILSLILLTAFVFNSKKVEKPMIDLTLFKNKVFLFGNIASWASFASLFCIMILMPFYLDEILNFSPAQIGLMMTPFPLAMALISPFSGSWSDKIGPIILTTLGLTINTLSIISLLFLDQDSSSYQIAIKMFALGLGTGLFQSPNNSSVMGSVPSSKLGVAGGVNALVRNLGMVIGITLSVSIFTNRLTKGIAGLADPTPQLEQIVFLQSLDFVFLWAAALSFFGVIISATRPKEELKKETPN